MGGVDMFDQLLGSYRPVIKGKKWWWPLFVNVVNITVVAAFRFYQHLHKADSVNHLNFRREVVLCLLKKDFTDDSSGSIPGARVGATGGGHHAILPMDIRTDGVGHINEPTSSGRCTVCHGSTRNKCRKCNVRLHFAHGKNCFDFYHLH